MNNPLLSAVALALLLNTSFAHAVEEHLISPNHPKADDISLDSGELFTGFFHAARSYECRVSQPRQGAGEAYPFFSTTVSGPGGAVAATAVGGLYPLESAPPSALGQQSFRRISFIPNATGSHSFSLQFAGGTSATGTVECFETSLAGGFNSFFAAVPIVELRNRGSQAVVVTIIATDFTGAVVDTATISVPPSSRADAILTVPPQRYGKVLATYLAPRESIEGTISEYDYGTAGQITLKRERPMTLTPIVP